MTTIFLQLYALVSDWHRRRNATLELANLSDATLRDIGLVRADIPRVVAEAIAAERAALIARQRSRVRTCTQESTELC